MKYFRPFLLKKTWTILLLLVFQNSFPMPLSEKPFTREEKEMIADSIFSQAYSLMYSRPDSAKSLILYMREHGADHPQSTWNIRTLNLLGILQDVQSVYDSALYYYYQAYSSAAALENYEHLGHTCNNIGLTHWHTGNYKDALDYFFQALDHYDKAEIARTTGNIHNNVGLIYGSLKNFELAWKQFYFAYEKFEENEDLRGIGAVLTNMGLLHLVSGEADSAKYFIEKSMEYKKKAMDDYGKCISLESMGRIYLFEEELKKARRFFKESYDLSKSIGFDYGAGRAKRGLANICIKEGKFTNALYYAEKAMDFAEKIEAEKLIYEVHETYAEIHERSGNYYQALRHSRMATHLRNESINHYRLHQVYDLELQHANKKSLREIEQLSKEKEIQRLQLERKDLEIGRKNTLILLIVVIFAFFLAGIYFLYHNYRHIQLARMQKALLANKETRSRAAIEAEMQERRRIGQELHDGLGQMLSIIRMNIGVLKKKEAMSGDKRKELFDSAVQTVDQAFKELRNISQNLAPAILSEISLEQALTVLALQINQTGQVKLHLETMGLENIPDNFTETTIYRAVQELITNAMKHSDAFNLHVQVISDEAQASIMVEDDGKGFTIDNVSLFNGSGLRNMQTRIENLNGSFFMDSRKGRGSIVQIFIPLKKVSHENKTH